MRTFDQVSIKIIYDNCKSHEEFQEGWGFSCLIDLGLRKILFDTGADEKAFFSNLQKLNVSCDEITDVVCSHKHKDHITGLKEIIGKLKGGTRLFMPKKFPLKRLPKHVHKTIVEDFKEIDKGIYSLVLKGGMFFYEQALVIETAKGLVVITGCAHPGVVRLLHEAQTRLNLPIYLVLGGFHLFRSSKSKIDDIISLFKALNVQIVAPCHCTGHQAIERFRQAFSTSFYKIGTGTILSLSS